MAYRETMVKGFSEALRSRFQLNSLEKSVVNATKILSTKHWPVDDAALRGYPTVSEFLLLFFYISCWRNCFFISSSFPVFKTYPPAYPFARD